MFQFIEKSQKNWMDSPQAVQSALAIGFRKKQFLENTENDVRPRIVQFRRGYNRYYEAVWSRVYSEDISSQLVNIIQKAESGQETFTFPAVLWTQIVYETMIAYHFIPKVDNEDLINGLAALFEGRLAGYFLEIEKDADNDQDFETTYFVADSFESQAIMEAQVDEFISRKNVFRENWLHHKEEMAPFLPEISYWEYIPGVPILLPHVAKSPAGKTAHVYGTYETLLQEYSEEFKQFIRENLDLTPDAGHEKISRGIKEQVGQLEEDLDEILLPGNLHNLRGTQRIADKIFRLYPSPRSMSLKEETAIRLLRVNPPRNLITRWGYHDMEELLKHRNALDVLALAPWAETHKYSTWNTEWLRENLRPKDFEMSPVEPLVVDYTEFPALTSMAEASSLYHLTSRVVISNLREGSGGEYPKIRFLTTTLKRIIEAEQYGKMWERFAQKFARDEFARCVINSIGGHWGMGMFSAHAIFEDIQQVILRNKLLKIAGHDWGLSGLAVDRAKEHLTRMANAYHLGLTLPDGVFVTCCAWSWASYSSKGGKGIPTPLSLMVERRRFSSEGETGRLTNTHTGRLWEIINPNVKNSATGEPVGYRLRGKTGSNTRFAQLPGSANDKRAGFAQKHFWVTQYDDDERFPAGSYPNQNPGGEGLPAWIKQDRSIDNEDLVVWYNLCQTHVSVPEDWPVLPAKMLSFKLEPAHFFEENPSIDVPPEHAIKDVEAWRTENQESLSLE